MSLEQLWAEARALVERERPLLEELQQIRQRKEQIEWAELPRAVGHSPRWQSHYAIVTQLQSAVTSRVRGRLRKRRVPVNGVDTEVRFGFHHSDGTPFANIETRVDVRRSGLPNNDAGLSFRMTFFGSCALLDHQTPADIRGQLELQIARWVAAVDVAAATLDIIPIPRKARPALPAPGVEAQP